jgi:hypothetical protein
MYPYYRLGAKIAADDIAGVQALYGAPSGSAAPISTQAAPLTLTIATPSQNSSTTGATVASSGSTTGGDSSLKVTWQTDHGSSGAASGTPNWNAASIPLAVGSNTITVTAVDGSRTAVETVNVTRTAAASPAPVSHTPPTLNLVSPAGNVVTTTAATLNVSGTASDSAGVTKVTWQASAGSGNASGTTTWTATAIPLYVGDNTIIVRAYDASGNMAWKSILVIRN